MWPKVSSSPASSPSHLSPSEALDYLQEPGHVDVEELSFPNIALRPVDFGSSSSITTSCSL
jgi:hypothetical protein